MKYSNNNETGQSIVIMAFAIVVLMGIMAVAIDGGRIYTLRRDAQNAADAAALQGARSLCRDEDFVLVAQQVAERGGFAGAGIVEVNNPPLYSDSVINDDQVEVVITATIDGGLIAPVVYQGELTTRVHAIGDCLRGTLSGSGSAIFAGASGCSGNEVSVQGSSVNIVGGVHSNGDVHVSGGGGGNYITGTVSHVGNPSVGHNTTLFPADGNPTQVTHTNYPINLEYADFVSAANSAYGEDGWAYTLMMADAPGDYHYFPPGSPPKPIGGSDLIAAGLMTGSDMAPGVYVAPTGFKFTTSDLKGDDVTFVSLNHIDFSSNRAQLRPYFSGLLLLTDADGNPCAPSAVIKMSGATVSWGGIIFAPNGNVNMSFSSNSTFFGSIIAGTVDVSGSQTTIIYDPSYLPPDPDTIELGT